MIQQGREGIQRPEQAIVAQICNYIGKFAVIKSALYADWYVAWSMLAYVCQLQLEIISRIDKQGAQKAR